MDSQLKFLEKSLKDFEKVTKKPETFLDPDEMLLDLVKNNLKIVYDFSKTQEKNVKKSKGLPKLLIQNFDTEQIWQELELQNDSLLAKSLNDVTRLIVNKNNLKFEDLNTQHENDLEDEKLEMNEDEDEDKNIDDGRIDEDELDENDDSEEEENTFIKPVHKTSEVDDNFFKLEEMENFLNQEDKKEFNQQQKNVTEESDSDEEESIDLFEEDEENLEEEVDESRVAKFKDFFRSNEPQRKDKPKRNKFLEEMEDDETGEEFKSSLEQRHERLKRKIEEIEENAVSEKPWTLKGEILADKRPQNSLLEEILEFDRTTRPAPIITENATLQLEDIIKQRIKDKVFDSVIRKEKPVDTPLEFKKKLTLDQEKSKHSLAQIYEKEYIDQQASLDPANAEKEEEEPSLHKEIKTMMRDLFNKLDALSNFHFTPKPALPELRVINNLPAISMEEVAPVTSTDASLLAPEEIKNKPKGEILGDSEKTKTDKNRERRKKKLKQKYHKQVISKNMMSKGKTNISEVLKNKNTHKMDETNAKSIKSSKAFFSQLQDQAKAHINKKLHTAGKKKDKNKLDAKKMKL